MFKSKYLLGEDYIYSFFKTSENQVIFIFQIDCFKSFLKRVIQIQSYFLKKI